MTVQTKFAAASLAVIAMVSGGLPVLAQRGPAPARVNLPPEILSLACAPKLAFEVPSTPIRVTGSQESMVHKLYGPGDLISINAGTDNGIEVGQQYYTRRIVPIERRAVGRDNPAMIQTTSWLRIWAVDDEMSLATITHACGGVELNDYLEPFTVPEEPAISVMKPKAQRGNYGRVMSGNDRRTLFGRGDYFLVDRGSDHGVSRGAQFVIYRDNQQPQTFLFELGEAVAVEVMPEWSALRGTISYDGFRSGDYVALRK
jgi:hypothetical protein